MLLISTAATTATASSPTSNPASGRLFIYCGIALAALFLIRFFKQWIHDMQESEE